MTVRDRDAPRRIVDDHADQALPGAFGIGLSTANVERFISFTPAKFSIPIHRGQSSDPPIERAYEPFQKLDRFVRRDPSACIQNWRLAPDMPPVAAAPACRGRSGIDEGGDWRRTPRTTPAIHSAPRPACHSTRWPRTASSPRRSRSSFHPEWSGCTRGWRTALRHHRAPDCGTPAMRAVACSSRHLRCTATRSRRTNLDRHRFRRESFQGIDDAPCVRLPTEAAHQRHDSKLLVHRHSPARCAVVRGLSRISADCRGADDCTNVSLWPCPPVGRYHGALDSAACRCCDRLEE